MIESLFFVSMALGAVLGFAIGFYLRYRWEKKHLSVKPSAEQCLGAGIYGGVVGALWLVTVPTAIIGGSLWLFLSGLMWALNKTGKFSD